MKRRNSLVPFLQQMKGNIARVACHILKTKPTNSLLHELEVYRVNSINDRKPQQNKEWVIQEATDGLQANKEMLSKWNECFPAGVLEEKKVTYYTLCVDPIAEIRSPLAQ